MKILGFNIGKKDNAPDMVDLPNGLGVTYPVDYQAYDGEKTDGDLGRPKEYALDYDAMAARAWQHFIDTDLVSIVLERYLEWIIGTGLTLQAVPDMKVIKSEGVEISQDALDEFTSVAESRFRLLANTTLSDYKQVDNLHKLSIEIIKNAYLSGDCLVIYRIDDDGLVNVDFVNGQNIKTPIGADIGDGNLIVQGVEFNLKGQHLAYWIQTSDLQYKRIAARDSFGRLRAELVCWKKTKRSDVRGISGLHSVFNKMKNIDRYTEATIQGAVSRANLAYFITTEKDAMVVGPTLRTPNQTAKETSKDDVNFNNTKRKIYADTSKTIYELQPGQDIHMPDSKGEAEVQGFVQAYFNQFCSGLGIPPEVALQLYTNSFSASRMATKSWEHTLRVKRSHYNVYKNMYSLFVDVQVAMNKIELPQLKVAIAHKNKFLVAAFTKCRLMGVNVPHADPVKESKAARILLGDENVPLITGNGVTESLGTGDYSEIVETRKREMQSEKEFNKTEEATPPNTNTTGNE